MVDRWGDRDNSRANDGDSGERVKMMDRVRE